MSHYFKNSRGLPAGSVAGFTLIELLVSISIISMILTVVVLNQSTYTDSAALTNLADEISSTISQAQVYGIAVKEVSTGSNTFNASYGLAFSLLGSGSNTAYIYFADLDANVVYTGTWSCGTSECLKKIDITRGNVIDKICAVKVSGTDNCNISRTDISFARPNTEAQIVLFNSSGNPSFLNANEKGVRIEFRSPRGSIRSVTVYSTGQISSL
ncbi:MAG: type II secretion system protein [Candidatus Zambryskibacteria bacterium]|nr:type II secretion system protein [Candidatus Zambryskibacteria bacterium]